MEFLNIFGLIFTIVLMIPNIIYALKFKDCFENKWSNKHLEVIEQIGRFGCIAFMTINIPGTWFGWWSDEAMALYLIGDTILAVLYCVLWIILFNKNNLVRALSLSIIPATLFFYSGIMSRSIPLIFFSIVFAFSHIVISYKNAK